MTWTSSASALLLAVVGCGRVDFDGVVADATPADAFVCPPGYARDTGSCYRAGTGQLAWLDAERACEADAPGAHLAVIDTAAEVSVIARYKPGPTDVAWIGAADLLSEGTYVSVLNRPLGFTTFDTGEPDGAADDCLNLHGNDLLGDFDCTALDDYVCEYDGQQPATVVWGECPDEYTFVTTGCYRFSGNFGASNTTWLAAEARCEIDGPGRHLAVVDNPEEAAAVVGFVPTNLFDFFVGASDLRNEGVFPSVTSGPFGYINWAANEPDGGAVENCVVLTSVPNIATTDCNNGDDFVCEYDGIAADPASWTP